MNLQPESQSELVFELVNICKTFPRLSGEAEQAGRKQVLCDVSMRIRPGEIYGFIGLNGAGKTTSIKIALGLTQPDTGEVRFFGGPASAASLKRIGFAPEKPSFNEFLSGEEILDYAARLLGLAPDAARKEEVLTKVGLWGEHHKKVGAYSKGMMQRLALAAAMLGDPDFFILDEPSSGLDPMGRCTIKNIMRDLQKAGKTIFFSTHILADVREICNRIGVIHEGRVIFEGGLEEFNPQSLDLESRFVEIISPSAS
jgi:ABC-type multidrug transport system ATPase subunit